MSYLLNCTLQTETAISIWPQNPKSVTEALIPDGIDLFQKEHMPIHVMAQVYAKNCTKIFHISTIVIPVCWTVCMFNHVQCFTFNHCYFEPDSVLIEKAVELFWRRLRKRCLYLSHNQRLRVEKRKMFLSRSTLWQRLGWWHQELLRLLVSYCPSGGYRWNSYQAEGFGFIHKKKVDLGLLIRFMQSNLTVFLRFYERLYCM